MSAATVIPDGLDPLGVWDAVSRDRVADMVLFHERLAWAKDNVRDVNDTYRVEFYLLDGPFMVVYRYRAHVLADGQGHRSTDPDTGDLVVEPPVIIPLGELPPAHLLTP